MIVVGTVALLAVPAAHPLLIPAIGVPSHLLWWVHVLPVAVLAYCWGRRVAVAATLGSIALLVAGERAFGAGYGTAASWDTVAALATALGGTHLLVASFALFARATAARLRNLFEAAPIGLLTVAPDGSIDDVNAAAVRTLGVEAAKLRRMSLTAILGVDALPPDSTEDSAVHDSTVHCLRPDGSAVELEIARVHSPGTQSMQLAIRDVTARNAMEKRLRQKQKMEALGGLAGGVAHDFNNILSVIGSTTDLLLAEPEIGSPEKRTDLLTIRSAVDRAAGLVRQLLTFGRRDAAAPGLASLAEVVAGMEPMILRLAGTRVRVVIPPDQAHTLVKADRVHLEQIVLNLVTNACDAMPEGGDLTIDVRKADRKGGPVAALRVSDTGTGIADSIRGRLFDPYFTTRAAERGTGLGLATVHSIVRRCGGDIDVQSVPGRGATFVVSLPEAEPEVWPARGRVGPVGTSDVGPIELQQGDLVSARP